ncbi:hypothetical protein TNIN_57981 [Trichonephila inaurata madagascariensis]|uniref:Uncharacterized protein n=1 Tax=Trichonephila inaurata madagascariensis TaxID=2747483 RepID=A0A8X6X5L6_9ARAC|nr:hypothetical protein TNIN_57981 [Trichonephila inaurata madagascariensis]
MTIRPSVIALITIRSRFRHPGFGKPGALQLQLMAFHSETRGRSSSTSQLHPRGAGVGNLVVVFTAGFCALCREEPTPGSGAPTFLPSHWSASLILLGKWFEGRDE